MSSTVVTVVGLALTAFVVLVAARPLWFRSWSVSRRDSEGRTVSRTRLGDAPPGSVTAVYAVVAVVLLVGTLVVRGWAVADAGCDLAEAVYQGGHGAEEWETAAEAEGLQLTTRERTSSSGTSSWTEHSLEQDGSVLASWSDAGGAWRFTCSR
ncbi:hypothetical protein [Auraticoccus monumenti]|uniref:Uncharacterized protein n=1 Tax=Auraticoccus monumenti TaxID=675864 RepID=A0A1G7F1J4_9ACTN|nr:hypothetical protein [Auraticoccus monumenti]SDE69712.1 hypothetical protein SAMN04489747_4114 [Auraticoccus monumenti]